MHRSFCISLYGKTWGPLMNSNTKSYLTGNKNWFHWIWQAWMLAVRDVLTKWEVAFRVNLLVLSVHYTWTIFHHQGKMLRLSSKHILYNMPLPPTNCPFQMLVLETNDNFTQSFSRKQKAGFDTCQALHDNVIAL